MKLSQWNSPCCNWSSKVSRQKTQFFSFSISIYLSLLFLPLLEVVHHVSAIGNPRGPIKPDIRVSPIGHELLQKVNHSSHLGVNEHPVPFSLQLSQELVQHRHLATVIDHVVLICIEEQWGDITVNATSVCIIYKKNHHTHEFNTCVYTANSKHTQTNKQTQRQNVHVHVYVYTVRLEDTTCKWTDDCATQCPPPLPPIVTRTVMTRCSTHLVCGCGTSHLVAEQRPVLPVVVGGAVPLASALVWV